MRQKSSSLALPVKIYHHESAAWQLGRYIPRKRGFSCPGRTARYQVAHQPGGRQAEFIAGRQGQHVYILRIPGNGAFGRVLAEKRIVRGLGDGDSLANTQP